LKSVYDACGRVGGKVGLGRLKKLEELDFNTLLSLPRNVLGIIETPSIQTYPLRIFKSQRKVLQLLETCSEMVRRGPNLREVDG
jgi:hypothetical protein